MNSKSLGSQEADVTPLRLTGLISIGKNEVSTTTAIRCESVEQSSATVSSGIKKSRRELRPSSPRLGGLVIFGLTIALLLSFGAASVSALPVTKPLPLGVTIGAGSQIDSAGVAMAAALLRGKNPERFAVRLTGFEQRASGPTSPSRASRSRSRSLILIS